MDVKDQHKTYRIHGMDCGTCAETLEKRLVMMRGVSDVEVNFSTAKMSIAYDGDENRLLRAVKQAGFTAERQIEGYGQQELSFWQSYPKAMTTLASGILFIMAWCFAQFTAIDAAMITAFYGAAIVVGGYRIAIVGVTGLKTKTIGIEFLMTIAVIGAAIIGEWAEGAAVIFLFSIGETLEAYSMDRTRKSVRSLMNLAPQEALVRRNEEEVVVRVEHVNIGDVLIIKPGERIAMDGIVETGYSMVNQAPITGESLPVEKQAGDNVYAGTINHQGAIEVKVTKLAKDNTIARIIELIEQAQAQKAPSQKFVDTFAQYYTPAVIVIAIGIAIIPPLFIGGDFTTWFYRALVMLVVSCPCALVISTPVAIVSAIGNAARNGVLIKGGVHLEKLGRLAAIAFDKTGTLTMGIPTVEHVEALSDLSEAEVIKLAAAVEMRSEHPLAQAIVRFAGDRGIEAVAGDDFHAFIGLGAVAVVNGRKVYIGSPKLFKERLGVTLSDDCIQLIDRLQEEGNTVILLGMENEGSSAAEHVKGYPPLSLLGLFGITDRLRESSVGAIEALQSSGIDKLHMLTGDHEGTAQAISRQLGGHIDYEAELMPEHKVDAIKTLMKKHEDVAMVGDGVNDAPALATATVGIAMGTAGTDTALETADIALMADDLEKLPYTVRLSRKTVAIIKQNITFALVLKAIFLLMIIPGWVTLWLAVVADVGASLVVILNGMRLLKFKS